MIQTLLNTGSGVLSTLFGDRLNSVITTITSALGTGSGSVSSLMKITAPLAKERTARGMGTAGLASLLAEQKGSLARLLPAGLAGTLGTGSGPLRQSAGVDSTFHDDRQPVEAARSAVCASGSGRHFRAPTSLWRAPFGSVIKPIILLSKVNSSNARFRLRTNGFTRSCSDISSGSSTRCPRTPACFPRCEKRLRSQ